jgi:cysteine desulfurase/selenocysteine lyase
MDAEALRDAIPVARESVYLNTGASGPSPRAVREAIDEAFVAHDDAHVSDNPYGHESEVADETREAVGSLVGAPPESIALTSNTTDGINIVADLFDWNEDDAVVTTELEHPAGVLPWERLAEVRGIEKRTVPTDGLALDREKYKDAVKETTLVCLSSTSWYGVSLPVSQLVEIAHDAGARVVVDAAQSVGAGEVDVDDWNADYVAAPAHKWLLGPWGSGFLYVSLDAPRDAQRRVGYKSVKDASLRGDARRLEFSTSSPALLAGTRAAVETVCAVGVEAVEERVSRLVARLENGLGDRHVSTGGGLVRFSDPTPDGTVARLKEEGVVVRALPDGNLRASVHAFNTTEDIDRLIDLL